MIKGFVLKSVLFCLLFLGLFMAKAGADDAQTSLARQIEEASVTSNQAFFDIGENTGWVLYEPPQYRREMQVHGCEITARTVALNTRNSTEEIITKITFDLSRTRIPDPSVSIGEDYAFMTTAEDESYGFAMLSLNFLPPYEPMLWSILSSKGEVEQPVSFIRFFMEPVLDEDQPRRLLALLNRYKSEYCEFSG